MLRSTFQLASAFLVLFIALPSDRARGGELDIVVTSKVEASKAFVKNSIPLISDQARSALYGLDGVDASDGKAKDGAARHRLFIEHKGTVTVGNKLVPRSGFPKTKQETVKNGNSTVVKIFPDPTHYHTVWLLPVKQTTTLTFSLQKWEDGAYKALDTWTYTVPNHEVIEKGGLAPVAELVQDGTKPGFKLNPDCPRTLEQAREEGFLQGLPGEFGQVIASRWVKGKFDKITKKSESEVDYGVTIENKSPWPLAQVHVESTDKDVTLAGYVEFKPAIPAGKSGKGTGSRFVTQIPKKTLGLRVTEVQFNSEK
jgi:hypothetical protein